MHDNSLNDNGFTFKDLEQKVYKLACDEACNSLKEILAWIINKNYKQHALHGSSSSF